jgi:type II secretory ATPase GspE/PulE/Tfp pilus assembly ATPase PilB-like protein
MVPVVKLTQAQGHRLLSSIKVLCDIDISQKNVIQEGHFSCQVPGRSIDYRISYTPAMHGQKLVIRVLDLANAPQFLDQLNLPRWMLNNIRKTAKQDAGMVLVCGPTGSGKTTTLYAVLRDIDVEQRNVITIEDPVEYQIGGVTQIPINEGQGNTFHTLLRSVLRQDPDVILLGEVRDRETADTAMQAAMTGHLVLSTVHAKDTIGTIFRLLDLGVEPYLVAQALNVVLAQRLIRKLCDACKAPKKPTPQQTMRMGGVNKSLKSIYYPVGCPRCLNTGFMGRRGLYELLTVSDALRDVILKHPTMASIHEALGRDVFISLQEMGYQIVAEGATAIEEVDRVCGSTT